MPRFNAAAMSPGSRIGRHNLVLRELLRGFLRFRADLGGQVRSFLRKRKRGLDKGSRLLLCRPTPARWLA